MKEARRFLFTVAMALVSLSASAYDFEADGIFYNILSAEERTCEVTYSYSDKYFGDIVVPPTVEFGGETFTVKALGNEAFFNCPELYSVQLPNTIIEIGAYALARNPNLSSFSFPNSIISICESVLSGCKEIKEISLPESVQYVGASAFSECPNLEKVELPNSTIVFGNAVFSSCERLPIDNNVRYAGTYAVEVIDRDCSSCTIKPGTEYLGSGLFGWMENLNSVSLPSSLKAIFGSAFYCCPSLVELEIPNSVSIIGNEVFRGCNCLMKMNIPENIVEIGDNAFSGCSSLGGELVFPETLTRLGISAFEGCSSLVSVSLPSSLARIESCTFNNCKSLITAVLPKSLKSIGWSAFGYTSLTKIEIPESIEVIEDNPFVGCSYLDEITVRENGRIKMESDCLISSDGVLIAALNRPTINIPASVSKIGSQAFMLQRKINEVTIPNTVTEIGVWAFFQCTGMVSINIPASVKTIANEAFYNCVNVRKVVFGCTANVANYLPVTGALNDITLEESVGNFLSYKFSDASAKLKLTSLSLEPPLLIKQQFTDSQLNFSEVFVLAESLAKYSQADGWKEFVNIKPIEGTALETCATPTVLVMEGRLFFESATPNSEVHYSITSDDIHSGSIGSNFAVPLSGQYNISFYATADGFQKSETVSAVLVWVSPSIFDPSGVISMEAKKAVVIKSVGGQIVVCGTDRGERVALFTFDGRELVSMSATDGETALPCNLPSGEIVIVRYGDKSVKIKL